MPQRKCAVPPASRGRPGALNAGALTRAAVVIAAGLGLAACVGPYADDGYGRTQYRYQDSYYDAGYDQQRRNDYRQSPFTPPGQLRSSNSLWRNDVDFRDRVDD